MDSRARRFLDMLAVANPRGASYETIGQRRDSFQNLMRLSEAPVPACTIEDHAFAGPEGHIGVRMYSPAGSGATRRPGLVYFHGGGLVAGSLDSYDGLCGTLAAEIGCRLLSVDYRLAPEHKFPAAVIDSYAATEWVSERATELRIDPERIAIAGDSAGGTLACIVSQMARQANGPKFALQLLLCPVMDCDPRTLSRRDHAEGYLLDQATMKKDLAHYVPAGLDLADSRLSPLRARNVEGLPDAYIHTAEFDPLRDEGNEYADRLARAGVKVNYTCHPGMIHHFYGMASIIPYAGQALKLIGAEIRTALA